MSYAYLISQRFFLRRKSQIYSAMAFVVPAAILTMSGRLDLKLSVLAGIAAIAASIVLLPKYVKLILRVEDAINLKLGRVTPARLVRIGFHIPWVIGVYQLVGPAWNSVPLAPDSAALLVAASCGLHGTAVALAYRGYGDRISNILLSFSLSAWLTAIYPLSTLGLYAACLAMLLFVWHMTQGVLSDLRSFIHPQTGVGMFFGTFNPVHITHLRIMKDALESRGLQKIYVHPTTIPKLHRVALASGEIAMSYQAGMRIYKKTALADPSKNYFPTGNKFYEYEVRKELLKASIRDAGLEGKVEVLDLPEIYDKHGFFGIVRYIKQQNPGLPVHGLHGSDVGGIWVRHIFDMSGWIYPCPVIRTDNISATAIREGAVGYTSTTVERFLAATRAEQEFVFPSGYVFQNSRTILQ